MLTTICILLVSSPFSVGGMLAKGWFVDYVPVFVLAECFKIFGTALILKKNKVTAEHTFLCFY